MTISDCYQILQMAPTLDMQKITAQYRQLALRYHPDRNGGDAEQFQKIHLAYKYLKDYSLIVSSIDTPTQRYRHISEADLVYKTRLKQLLANKAKPKTSKNFLKAILKYLKR